MDFETSPLFRLESKKKLSKILSIDAKALKDLEASFQCFPFTKKKGNKVRELYDQDVRYKRMLRKLNSLLQSTEYPAYVFGGMRGKDHKLHALYHTTENNDNLHVCKIDIKDFFPSTKDSYVYGFFKNKLKMSPDVSRILTLLTTQPSRDKDSRNLPQGFPTSTILSYLSYFDMFNGIYILAARFNIKFSLFVDDMVFSKSSSIPKNFIKQVINIISKYELTIHPRKIKYYAGDQAKKITGVIVTDKKAIRSSNALQKEMYQNFLRLKQFPLAEVQNQPMPMKDDVRKLILVLKGQLHAIKYVETYRLFPHIHKVIKEYENFYM
ncbi:reverse transcriptase family protein [Bacillus sp. JJ634]